MSLWTDIRDTAESAAVLAGNYMLPGSAALTSKLVSGGAQKQLGSTLGQAALLGSGGYGAMEGNLANYSTAYDKVAGAFGGGGIGGQITGQQAVDAFNAGKISAAEFEAIANGAGTTSQGLLSGAGASKYLTPAAILGSSLFGAQAASKAASTQAEAQSQANQLAYAMWQQQQEQQKPWRQAGERALGKLETAAEYTPFSYNAMTADPGYAFRISEGQKALDRSAAARGGLMSGGALKAAARFGQDMASQEYTNAFNRYQTERAAKLAPLQSLAGIGQTAANTLTNAAGNYSTVAGQGITDLGRVNAAGYQGAANALGTGVSQYLGQMNNADLINALRRNA